MGNPFEPGSACVVHFLVWNTSSRRLCAPYRKPWTFYGCGLAHVHNPKNRLVRNHQEKRNGGMIFRKSENAEKLFAIGCLCEYVNM